MVAKEPKGKRGQADPIRVVVVPDREPNEERVVEFLRWLIAEASEHARKRAEERREPPPDR
jgi:hypothetical protein